MPQACISTRSLCKPSAASSVGAFLGPSGFQGLAEVQKHIQHVQAPACASVELLAAWSTISWRPGLQGLAKVHKREQQVRRQRELQQALGRQADLLAQHKRLVEKHLHRGQGAHPQVVMHVPCNTFTKNSAAATTANHRRELTSHHVSS